MALTRLIDLHAHFPMHTRFPPRFVQGPPPVGKEIEFWAATHLLDFQKGEPRVSLANLLAGSPGGIGSVLNDPDDEFFRDANPVPGAFENLLAQMDNVEAEVKGSVRVVRNPADLGQALDAGEKFLFHCVEGAFAFAGDPTNVDRLAARGAAYVVVAHLFFRGVATCNNALPNVPDLVFKDLLNTHQDPSVGLTPLGRGIVDRLLQNRILVDITHSTELAQQQIFDMARDHGNAPVISSHTGVRPTSDYPLNLSPAAIRRIAESNGVIGIILFPHWLRQRHQQFLGSEGIDLVFRAIDSVHDILGNYDHIAIGSDLDGFIQPIKECQNYSETPQLVAAIQNKYGANGEKILWRNALDVLQRGWKGV